MQQRVHDIPLYGGVALPFVIVPAGAAVHLFALGKFFELFPAADAVRGVPDGDGDRKFDRDERHDGDRRRARGEQQDERLVRSRQKHCQHRARADETLVVQLCRHHRKAALRDDADRRAQKGREPAAQYVAVVADVRPVFQDLDEKIHQKQERENFQAVDQRV